MYNIMRVNCILQYMLHQIKCIDPFFYQIEIGIKTLELRFNDRDYKVGDSLCLTEIKSGKPTGQWITRRIVYMLSGEEAEKFGLQKGYCILGIK